MKNSYMHSNYWTEFLMNFEILCTHLAESLIKKCLADGRLFLPLKSAADTDKTFDIQKES